jgi:hypothetical protein
MFSSGVFYVNILLVRLISYVIPFFILIINNNNNNNNNVVVLLFCCCYYYDLYCYYPFNL